MKHHPIPVNESISAPEQRRELCEPTSGSNADNQTGKGPIL